MLAVNVVLRVVRSALGLLGGLCLSTASCRGREAPLPAVEPRPVTAHYVDADGSVLDEYDALWAQLSRFYQSPRPATIHVRRRPSGTSMFDVPSSTVLISAASLHGGPERPTIAHESSHLFLAEITAAASTLDAFRFIDEGLACVIEHEVGGGIDAYRDRALRRAAGRLREGPITFERVQRWSTYFGTPERGLDFGAYDVGASFVFFVRDTWGDGRLLDLLRALGVTRSLESAVERSLGRPLPEVEAAWIAYVGRVPVSVPQVVEQIPANGSRAASTTLAEVTVTFDVEMSPSICVLTPCQEGICFDHARWTTARTLAIAIERPLLSAHAYTLSLGTPTCRMQSRAGVELPVTVWRFETQ
jgi:hypothetical protein